MGQIMQGPVVIYITDLGLYPKNNGKSLKSLSL